jgi:hypothetical protein
VRIQQYQAGAVTIQCRFYDGAVILLCWDSTSSLFCSDIETVIRFANRTLLGHGLADIRDWLTLMVTGGRL